MICLPNPLAIPNPALAQSVVQALQVHFSTSLVAWLEKCYGLTFIGEEKRDNRIYRYPTLYINDGNTKFQYIKPDNRIKSLCFFELNGNHEVESDNDLPANAYRIIYDLSCVVWLNLSKIDFRNYDFASELIRDMIDYGFLSFETTGEIRSIEITAIDQRPASVFDRYSYSQTDERQFLMYPYSGFKIDFTATCEYGASCLPKWVPTGTPPDCTTIIGIDEQQIEETNTIG